MTLTDPHISRHRGAQTCSATVKAPLLPSHDLDPSSPSKLPDLSVLLLEHLVSMSLLNPQSKDQKVFGQSSTKGPRGSTVGGGAFGQHGPFMPTMRGLIKNSTAEIKEGITLFSFSIGSTNSQISRPMNSSWQERAMQIRNTLLE
ncbi:uncharacterized protein LOC131594760 [Vicia villosa]|uniref:uncharacterized protein LOC131594760 n=1 Tax=Vicia villosa TaxID=3911 RepID=UPI00273C78F9|nr:uncharacterized protein LOC131594760 [Vicia villosa]XP_058722944.1 uncharacterized protein LOC131594760 [Vicia villosa]XP_058722945.1 uncharacterized protein LOC131594760 [Vicia villosa]XP_058722946.1 uncharacterized protein LOC131594760 [Vicia villosa]XP_058722947.1 uncharacterized protein LOC131594760 [Vicia villosa]